MKNLKNILLAGAVAISSYLPSLAEEELATNFKKTTLGLFSVNEKAYEDINPEKKSKKHNTTLEEYEERQNRYNAKGVDINRLMKYLDEEHKENKVASALVYTHDSLTEGFEDIEEKMDEYLLRHGLEDWSIKITGGKEDSIASISLIYRFDWGSRD